MCTSSRSDANGGGVSFDLSGGRVWLRWSFKALSLHPPQWIEGVNSNALKVHIIILCSVLHANSCYERVLRAVLHLHV